MRIGVAVPAAGLGRRMGEVKKQYLQLLGEPVLLRSIRPFLDRSDVESVVVALPAEDSADPPDWLTRVDPRVHVVKGGASRQASVRAAIMRLPDRLDVIMVHDGARPLVTPEIIGRCLDAVESGCGAVAGVAAVDTLKEVGPTGRVVGTPDRSRIWHAQTPQAFPAALIRAAYQGGDDVAGEATDDASLLERAGGQVFMVQGSWKNLKVTRPDDVSLAELFLRMRREGLAE